MSRSATRSIALVASTLMLLGGCAAMRAGGHADGSGAAWTPQISADLAELASQPAPAPDSTVKSANPALRMIDDRVVIDAVASGDVNALKADLEALGMREAVASGRIVSGQLPVSSIAALNGLATLQFARPAYAATHPAR